MVELDTNRMAERRRSVAQALDGLFDPGTIAVVGASRTRGKLGQAVLALLKSNGYRGRIIPVNPSGGEIEGLEAVRSLEEIGGPIDVVVLATPVGVALDALESCTRLLPLARPDHLVLPGHKLPFTGLAARLEQLIDNHHGALARLRTHLREPATAASCFMALYGRSIGAGEYGLALVEAIGHLNHLHRLGEISREPGADGAYRWHIC